MKFAEQMDQLTIVNGGSNMKNSIILISFLLTQMTCLQLKAQITLNELKYKLDEEYRLFQHEDSLPCIITNTINELNSDRKVLWLWPVKKVKKRVHKQHVKSASMYVTHVFEFREFYFIFCVTSSSGGSMSIFYIFDKNSRSIDKYLCDMRYIQNSHELLKMIQSRILEGSIDSLEE